MRVTNIDTLSAYFDRLVTERIKWFFFNKDGDSARTSHQEVVVEEIKRKIEALLIESFEQGGYEYKQEFRTFNESDIVESLDELIINDINIGEADRARLAEVQAQEPNLDRMIVNEKRLRKANEGRARNKNKIDESLKNAFNG